jgi:hypothetical protein
MMNGAPHSGAGVRKPPREETAGGDEVARQKLWGFRRADVRYCVPGKADMHCRRSQTLPTWALVAHYPERQFRVLCMQSEEL